jgi:SAM-dependent methyltransferase
VNPWLEIPLADYEGHMDLPEVGQAAYLAGRLEAWARTTGARSVAVLGCAGGNGFDRLPRPQVERVVGIDLNPDYLAVARDRHRGRFPRLELLAGDLLDPAFRLEDPVDLAFAGLFFEYVDVAAALAKVRALLNPGGRLGAVLQLPNETIAEVTPTPYRSLERLGGLMALADPDRFAALAGAAGYRLAGSNLSRLASGKAFQEFLLEA